jgi:16S rRNA (cytosine1402-N4)-methyltransferase
LPTCLRHGGRVAILSFHSGEDCRVKTAFKEGLRDGVYASITEEVIRPSAEEKRDNPRSSSAKLRFAVRR